MKTVGPLRVPWVRIPPPPPAYWRLEKDKRIKDIESVEGRKKGFKYMELKDSRHMELVGVRG